MRRDAGDAAGVSTGHDEKRKMQKSRKTIPVLQSPSQSNLTSAAARLFCAVRTFLSESGRWSTQSLAKQLLKAACVIR
jgi:hypothetical protein